MYLQYAKSPLKKRNANTRNKANALNVIKPDIWHAIALPRRNKKETNLSNHAHPLERVHLGDQTHLHGDSALINDHIANLRTSDLHISKKLMKILTTMFHHQTLM